MLLLFLEDNKPLDKENAMLYNLTAQHSTAQHSTAQHSTAQHSTAVVLRLFYYALNRRPG
ncbi:hypothetical protein [Lactococcus formosensis]|uniref:hypothetical protein n=1 Tax=Lactococcus formosensis TaxID=1281486 RepID=UPI0024354823|nr:hypothetical protein [Lactococcus formosensis]MDG6150805.1 hypothetical protein [Lactococcus formosensis]